MAQPMCGSVVGTTGTGKSTLIRDDIIKNYLEKNPNGRVLIVTYNDEPKIWQPYPEVSTIEKPIKHAGIAKATIVKHAETPKKFFKKLSKTLRNALLVLDDCRIYVPSNITTQLPDLFQMIINHRHKGLNMVFVAHAHKQVPPSVRPFLKYSFIGYCTTKIPTNYEVEDPQVLIKKQMLINNMIRKKKVKYGEFIFHEF